MAVVPVDPDPIFHGPIARGDEVRILLRRSGLFALTALAHALVLLVLLATHLLIVESVDAPKAVTAARLFFRTPDSLPGDRGGGAGNAAGGRSLSTVAPRPAPPIQPPPERPMVIPLPPPALEPNDGPADRSPESAALPGPGDGTSPGPGTSDGTGTGGGGRDGPGDGPGPPGPGSDVPVYDEHHPDITPPVQIAGRAYPRYPDLARKAGVQGTVILLVVIDSDGRVGEIQVLRAPDPRFGFDLAAIEAVKQWRYRPALLGGRPVAVQASVTIEFSISR